MGLAQGCLPSFSAGHSALSEWGLPARGETVVTNPTLLENEDSSIKNEDSSRWIVAGDLESLHRN